LSEIRKKVNIEYGINQIFHKEKMRTILFIKNFWRKKEL